ncbi:MAG: class I SAM-dependent methyltransferase [Planctomycetota bacterium]|jgi:hypothetical protein
MRKGLSIVEECLKQETERLTKSWMQYDRATLRNYLVQDEQDPRINVQSILTRHFLIERLFGRQFAGVMEQELRFALVVNWLLTLLKRPVRAEQLRTVLDTLLGGKDNGADEIEIPQFISETFASLAVPNYICDLFSWAPVEITEAHIPEYLVVTFQTIWQEILECEQPENIFVVEPACGSANDYRFIDAFSFAKFLNYTGFDLCEKNIRNAKKMFPDVRFEVGNVFAIDATDNTFDYCFMHDLFEHLSIEAMEAAISEICRVTRRDICVGFFNMHNGDEHIVKPINDYHWNNLSMTKTKGIFERYASEVQIVHIDTFLRSQFGYHDTHNKGAYTFVIKK